MKLGRSSEEEAHRADGAKPKRPGPPNRMNDLPYREWMKFQKSFFRHESWDRLISECVHFFTKSVWSDGTPSRSLLVGFEEAGQPEISGRREVEWYRDGSRSTSRLIQKLRSRADSAEVYDFVLVDMRDALHDPRAVDEFIADSSTTFFSLLRDLLVPGRYCGVVVDMPEGPEYRFPVPWAVALSARGQVRLRDEKIGLVEDDDRTFYTLYFQADDDRRSPQAVTSNGLQVSKAPIPLPAWLMPKSPPRKRAEKWHPAKFPEALIETFLLAFTSEGDLVLDPMAGTGSALIAARQLGRKGVGVELNPDFVGIARDRFYESFPPMLYPPDELASTLRVFEGDATRLREIKELQGLRAQYCVTSPPYWSVLHNRGSEYQRGRRQRDLPTVYSTESRDIGNMQDYDEFLDAVCGIFSGVGDMLDEHGLLTVVVKNLKRKHVMYTLAWDLAFRLCGPGGDYDYVGSTLWCQDDVGIKPFAVGTHWVSNILHHYCLHMARRS